MGFRRYIAIKSKFVDVQLIIVIKTGLSVAIKSTE